MRPTSTPPCGAGLNAIRASTPTSPRPRRPGSTWSSACSPISPVVVCVGDAFAVPPNSNQRSDATLTTATPLPNRSFGPKGPTPSFENTNGLNGTLFRGRDTRLWPLAIGVMALGAVLVVREIGPLATWNHTPSLPEGLYVRSLLTQPAVGQIVAFPAPAAALDYARLRGGRGDKTLFLKPLAAGPGDHVCVTDHLTINAQQIAPVFDAGFDGIPLPRWRECQILAQGEWFAYAPRIPNSLDSRYNHACASPHGRRSAAVGALQIWLFSSTDRAWSGGLIYSPTTSRTLSTKAGSRETLNPLMRLQAVLAPDLLDGGLAQANRPGQAARAPVRGVRRHRALHHRAHLVRPDHRRPPRTWPVAQQAIHAFGDEPFPPPPNRALGFADLTHDRHRANTRGRQQHDPHPPHVFLLHTRGGDDGFQTRPRRRRHSDLRFLFTPTIWVAQPQTGTLLHGQNTRVLPLSRV